MPVERMSEHVSCCVKFEGTEEGTPQNNMIDQRQVGPEKRKQKKKETRREKMKSAYHIVLCGENV